MKLIDYIKDGNRVKKCKFSRYRKNHLYYITECGFEFPVPIEDIGDATFANEEKASLMMRYIRKHLNTLSNQ